MHLGTMINVPTVAGPLIPPPPIFQSPSLPIMHDRGTFPHPHKPLFNHNYNDTARRSPYYLHDLIKIKSSYKNSGSSVKNRSTTSPKKWKSTTRGSGTSPGINGSGTHFERDQERRKARQARTLKTVRFAVQKVCLPLILIIGIPGNLFTLIILSRHHMKSSTNFYLAALAFADMFYLLFHFVLSLQHYPLAHGNYWYLAYLVAGFPLTDIFSNASVWIVVSFTAERFFVIYNPIKGKVWCTMARAKRIVYAVFVIAILGTLPTFFERKVILSHTQHQASDQTASSPFATTSRTLPPIAYITYQQKIGRTTYGIKLPTTYNYPLPSPGPISTTIDTYDDEDDGGGTMLRAVPIHLSDTINGWWSLTNASRYPIENDTRSQVRTKSTYMLSDTKLFLNKNYQKGYFWFTSIFFCIFPLTLLLIFNSLLIIWIRKSSVIHRKMNRTWRARESQVGNKRGTFMQNQETRITYMLIIVVLVFTLCQLPSAILLLAFLLKPANQEVVTWRLMNNFANLLVAIHACLNFILYCLLSRKFRLTFSKLFLPCLEIPNKINWIQESRMFQRDSNLSQGTMTKSVALLHQDDNLTNRDDLTRKGNISNTTVIREPDSQPQMPNDSHQNTPVSIRSNCNNRGSASSHRYPSQHRHHHKLNVDHRPQRSKKGARTTNGCPEVMETLSKKESWTPPVNGTLAGLQPNVAKQHTKHSNGSTTGPKKVRRGFFRRNRRMGKAHSSSKDSVNNDDPRPYPYDSYEGEDFTGL